MGLHHRLSSLVSLDGTPLLHLRGSFSGAGSDVDVLHQNEVGDWHFKYARQFGAVWYQSGCLGVRVSSLITHHAFLRKVIEGTFGDR